MKFKPSTAKVLRRSQVLYLLVLLELASGVTALVFFAQQGVDITSFAVWMFATGAAGVATTLFIVMERWDQSNAETIMTEEPDISTTTTLHMIQELSIDPRMVQANLDMPEQSTTINEIDLSSEIQPTALSSALSSTGLMKIQKQEKAKKERKRKESASRETPRVF